MEIHYYMVFMVLLTNKLTNLQCQFWHPSAWFSLSGLNLILFSGPPEVEDPLILYTLSIKDHSVGKRLKISSDVSLQTDSHHHQQTRTKYPVVDGLKDDVTRLRELTWRDFQWPSFIGSASIAQRLKLCFILAYNKAVFFCDGSSWEDMRVSLFLVILCLERMSISGYVQKSTEHILNVSLLSDCGLMMVMLLDIKNEMHEL